MSNCILASWASSRVGLAVDAGEGELVRVSLVAADSAPRTRTRGLVADGASEETLAATGWAQDQNVLCSCSSGRWRAVDQAAVETRAELR